jgi:putative hemolysin
MKVFAGVSGALMMAASLLWISGCDTKEPEQTGVSIANPASEYCLKQGGRLEIIKEAAGEKGMCHLPDGTVIEEWALFRRDHS